MKKLDIDLAKIIRKHYNLFRLVTEEEIRAEILNLKRRNNLNLMDDLDCRLLAEVEVAANRSIGEICECLRY